MATELKVRTPPSPQTRVSAAPARSGLFWPRLAPALLSGGLLWLCYFPIGWGWLAWVAVVPLLCLVRAQGRPAVIYLSAWAGGIAFFVPALYWMSVADHRMIYAWIALALYCALYFPAAIWLLRRLDHSTRLPLMLTVPVVWTALELLRSVLMTGFPWYFLGHSQHAYLGVIQIADVTGAYGVTFLVALVNAWVFERLVAVPWFVRFVRLRETQPASGRVRTVVEAIALVGLIIGVLAYGVWRLDQEDFKPGPRIVLLQGNLDQRLRNRAASDLEARRLISRHYGELAELALRQRPDLIIWPETSYQLEWIDVRGRPMSEEMRTRQFAILDPVRMTKTNHLLGVNSVVLDHGEERRYNTALLVTSPFDFSQRYDKIHRVPFGEYVPLRDWLPFLDNFAPYDYDYSISVGEKYTRFVLGKFRFGVLICFEDADPVLARQYARIQSGAPYEPTVDFLVNISNDGWFDGTSEHEEHLAVSRFRAIECRRAIVRAVNMGISAVVDSNGRVQEPQLVSFDSPLRNWVIVERDGRVPDLPESRWHQFKKVHGILTATVPVDQRTSFYAEWGDWLPVTCWVMIAVGLGWGIVWRWYWTDLSTPKAVSYRAPVSPELKPHAGK